jgi:hypothetical protein
VGEASANPHVKDEVSRGRVAVSLLMIENCLLQDGNTLLHLSIPKPPLLQYLLEEGNINPEQQNNVNIAILEG